MPRHFHRHWIKPRFRSLRQFIKYRNWWRSQSQKDSESYLSSHLSSHLSRPELDLSSHLNRDLNYHLQINKMKNQIPQTEHQLDISDR